ncbi:RUN and FYVE domain-containing protein 4 isoform B [Patagioenas fasciata monilis]|uniref:RUN and FYVE domain-containing protein 4 n=1 Tax=Patagioenas fasciata monilis TaxID=372326 RepID=A0A1V4K5Y6_PATFA|nr:RUN and FYVE domain-containing protein 4 isoform B [Patagioenas fasciata monilis]
MAPSSPPCGTGTKGEAGGCSVGAATCQHPLGTQQAPQSTPRLFSQRPQGTAMSGNGELNRVIKDLQKTVAELNHSYQEQNLPVTDGSRELHSLCAQLEFLLQFDMKEKRSFFGQRKDYWDFLCQGLARCRQEHEGIRFVTSLDKLKTPVGRGRAFLRYCLVHRQLAESLQLCLLDLESLREWYYARSPFLSPQHRAEILVSLYELDGITFHLALHRADLDIAWPMFSETLVRPNVMAGSSPAKTALQTDNTSIKAHGWPDGIAHSTAAPHGVPAHPCSPTLAAPSAESVEVEDAEWDVEDKEMKKNVEEEGEKEVKDEKEEEEDDEEEVEDAEVDEEDVQVEKDVEEEDEEELEEDEKEVKHVDVEELEDAHGSGKAFQPSGDRELGTSSLPSMEVIPGSPPLVPSQPSRTEASLRVLVSQLQAELEQQEVASRALSAQLAREKRRHQQQEEASAQWAQLQAQEAEALRETNIFLVQALEATMAAGDPGALVRAQEEAQGWREAAEERDSRLAGALAEAAALALRLQDCQVALAAAEGRTDALGDAGAPDEVATVKEVLQRALELACRPQEPPLDLQADEEPVTAAGMAMRLAALAAAAREEARQSWQQLQVQRQEVARLQEQLSRARQDRERWASALQRAQREALEREAMRGAEQARQQELIRDMKGRLLELLREKDALWQKTEGIDNPMSSPAPCDAGLCARCRKDFRLLSRRYNCRLCHSKVCHTCSVDVGKQGRCCLLCYQQRHPQTT